MLEAQCWMLDDDSQMTTMSYAKINMKEKAFEPRRYEVESSSLKTEY